MIPGFGLGGCQRKIEVERFPANLPRSQATTCQQQGEEPLQVMRFECRSASQQVRALCFLACLLELTSGRFTLGQVSAGLAGRDRR